mgnify:CR=1 FL=1
MLAQLTLLAATAAPLLGEVAHQRHTEVSSAADSKHKSPFAERPLLFETQLGIAMPTGTIGGFVDYSVFPALSLAAGAGTNFVGFEGALELRM